MAGNVTGELPVIRFADIESRDKDTEYDEEKYWDNDDSKPASQDIIPKTESDDTKPTPPSPTPKTDTDSKDITPVTPAPQTESEDETPTPVRIVNSSHSGCSAGIFGAFALLLMFFRKND